MKKFNESELLDMAIAAVIDDADYSVEEKTEVLALLFDKRSTALFSEKLTEEGANK